MSPAVGSYQYFSSFSADAIRVPQQFCPDPLGLIAQADQLAGEYQPQEDSVAAQFTYVTGGSVASGRSFARITKRNTVLRCDDDERAPKLFDVIDGQLSINPGGLAHLRAKADQLFQQTQLPPVFGAIVSANSSLLARRAEAEDLVRGICFLHVGGLKPAVNYMIALSDLAEKHPEADVLGILIEHAERDEFIRDVLGFYLAVYSRQIEPRHVSGLKRIADIDPTFKRDLDEISARGMDNGLLTALVIEPQK